MKKIVVTVRFLYTQKKGKDEAYYQNLAFDEIYNSTDTLDASGFEVEELEVEK
jgi:hypothetical protein